jgi:hypothetical protein
MTMELSLGAGGGYEIAENNFSYTWNILDPAFYFSANPKFYYNRQKRVEKNRRSDLNAGNYVGFKIKYTTIAIDEAPGIYDAILMNIHWGLQRAMGKRWLFNAHFGGGYAVDATDLNKINGTLYPAVDIRFSYVFSRLR